MFNLSHNFINLYMTREQSMAIYEPLWRGAFRYNYCLWMVFVRVLCFLFWGEQIILCHQTWNQYTYSKLNNISYSLVAFLSLISPLCSSSYSQPIVLTIFRLASALNGQIQQSYQWERKHLLQNSNLNII